MTIERLATTVTGSPLRIAVSRARPAQQLCATPLLYVHGGTFPSELAVGYRIDGRSWRDALLAEGYEVWAFDLLGYGHSDRYPEMSGDAQATAPLGRAPSAARQLAAVVALIQAHTAAPRVSLIAHSWGSMVAGLFASRCPWAIERLVFFGPVVRRDRPRHDTTPPPALPGWTRLGIEAQRQRFAADLPPDQPPAMPQFERWAADYLASEPDGGAGVRIPTGPLADIDAAWRGSLAYDPALIAAPLCVLRGEWDSLCDDADAAWLLAQLPAGVRRHDVRLARGTHLMHLESGRTRLFDAAHEFLSDGGTNGKIRRDRRDLRGAAA
jgi:pimeloyl-ACP methyl ester carboxylesterase